MTTVSVQQESPKVNPQTEALPRDVTIRRSQTARIAAIFASVTSGQYHGCAGGRAEYSADGAREVYECDLRAKLKVQPNGAFVIDLPYGWIDLVTVPAVEVVA